MFHPTDQISPVNVDSTSIAQASPTGKRVVDERIAPHFWGSRLTRSLTSIIFARRGSRVISTSTKR